MVCVISGSLCYIIIDSFSFISTLVRRGQIFYFRTSVTEANPNVSGKDSTSSTASTGSEGSTSGSEGSELEGTLEDSCGESVKLESNSAAGAISLKVSRFDSCLFFLIAS